MTLTERKHLDGMIARAWAARNEGMRLTRIGHHNRAAVMLAEAKKWHKYIERCTDEC